MSDRRRRGPDVVAAAGRGRPALVAALVGVVAALAAAAMPVAGAGGAVWQLQRSGTEMTLSGVDFADARHGWAVGGEGERNERCAIVATDDGGANWRPAACPAAHRLEDVSFADARRGWAVGFDGAIVSTSDGGASWQEQASGTSARLTSVRHVSGDTVWATAAGSDYALRTDDGGRSWRRAPLGKKHDLSTIFFVDPSHGWALGGDGVVLLTTDGGGSWTQVDYGSRRRAYAIAFADTRHGWLAGSEIRVTEDGGRTWRQQATPDQVSNTVRDLVMFDARQGYAVGDEGLLLRTADGGATWERQQRDLTRLALLDAADAGPQYLWAVGVKGAILHGRDPGASVGPTTTPTPPPTATRVPTPTLTPTPTGPWLSIGDPSRPIHVPADGSAEVTVVWGNMPATIAIHAELTGPATFADGSRSLDANVTRSGGAGSYVLALRAAPGVLPGERFLLRVTMEGLTAGRPGVVAWSVLLPLLSRPAPRR